MQAFLKAEPYKFIDVSLIKQNMPKAGWIGGVRHIDIKARGESKAEYQKISYFAMMPLSRRQ